MYYLVYTYIIIIFSTAGFQLTPLLVPVCILTMRQCPVTQYTLIDILLKEGNRITTLTITHINI
jgi:hypothetical protein